jgi:signal transduction histidine kinase
MDRKRPTDSGIPGIHQTHTKPSSLLRAESGSDALDGVDEIAGVMGLFQGLEELFSVLIHSGKNQLGPIKGYASLIQDDNDDSTNTRRWADKIMRNVRLMEDHFELLSSYRIRGAVGLADTTWQRVVSLVMDCFASVNTKGVPIEIVNNTRGSIRQHEKLITRVLTHVIVNAYESLKDGGKLAVSIDEIQCADDGRKRYRVRVTDTGCGIKGKDIGLVWKPFFTTKHNHIGLGLSYVAAAASILDMETEVVSSAGRGTTVTLILSEQGG